MNNKGQIAGLAIIVTIFVFLIGFGTLNLIKPEVTTARGSSGLDCDNPTNITDGTKLTCLAVDLTIPIIIWALISIFAGATVGRFVQLKR